MGCPVDFKQDGVSIHDFMGVENLQADFANEYLGGGVLSGGGSQEEAMFGEGTELLVTMFLVEKMLPFEAVEIHGARKYVEHNLAGARHRPRADQYCRPAQMADAIAVVVALDAICYNAYGQVKKADQYKPAQIQRELRKCLVALNSPTAAAPKRSFITGLWGCGAF